MQKILAHPILAKELEQQEDARKKLAEKEKEAHGFFELCFTDSESNLHKYYIESVVNNGSGIIVFAHPLAGKDVPR